MTGFLLASVAGAGMYLVLTSGAAGSRASPRGSATLALAARRWLVQAGLRDVRLRDIATVMLTLFVLAAVAGYAVFGGPLPAVLLGGFAASLPVASYRMRREANLAAAMDAWPRLLEELRVLTGSLGRSIPQALFEVGRRAPGDLRPAFEAAEREWLLSTDFARTVSVLKEAVAHPTADAVCETLLVAHEVGGSDLDRRLQALIEDRVQDSQGRKDAQAKQAGARFARRFVLVVPAGMALAGMSVGTGREAYRSSMGQALVAAAIVLAVGCWVWAGRIMRLPEEERVFDA